ncbi:MAG: hypothetical protein HQK67_04505 [Desulfamplus sp.]|nr:hypothetical protein [Desulfamplus sp.]
MDMNNFTISGLIMLAGSCCVFLFERLAGLMERPDWSDMILGDFGYDMWVAISSKMPMVAMQNGFDYVVFELPLWILLLIIGVLCVIIGQSLKK